MRRLCSLVVSRRAFANKMQVRPDSEAYSMRSYKIEIPSGALTLVAAMERPSLCPCPAEGRVLAVFPTDDADLEAVMYNSAGGILISPTDSLAALSYLFGTLRGIPPESVSIKVCSDVYELPKVNTPDGIIRVSLEKCKRIFTSVKELSGGVPERLVTVVSRDVTRIVRANPNAPYPRELLKRVRIIDGLPDAARTVAYFAEGEILRAVSTDKHECTDSIAPLAQLLASEYMTGSIRINTPRATYNFFAEGEHVYADYRPRLIP